MHSDVAAKIATLHTAGGATAFPQMSAQGGVLVGTEAVVSDAVPFGMLLLTGANAVAGVAEPVVVDMFSQGMLQGSDAPDSPQVGTSSFESLWQLNEVAITAGRYYATRKLRDSAAGAISNASGWLPGSSP